MNSLLSFLLRAPLRGLGLLVWALPRSWELALGRALGRAALTVERRRRAVIEENMRRCLPELDEEARFALLRANSEHYGMLLLELLHMLAPIPGHWRAYAERNGALVNFERWRRAHAKGRGVLFCSLHMGNWELMAAAGALGGIPLTIVTRRLKPKWLHRWVEAVRLSAGVRCALQPRTMPPVLKALKARESVGFVMDQYMPPPMGAPLLFFGARVHTLTAIIPLARRTGAAVLPAKQVRGGDGIVRVIFEPEFELSGDDDADNQRLADLVARWVREEPSQWLWAHRRFKDAVWDAAPAAAGAALSSIAS